MLDPTTGEILALASTPTYDASAIADPSTAQETFEALQDDPDNPLLPRATLGRYVPGSVFKIVTAIAGLGSGAITPETTFPEQAEAGDDGLLVNGFRIRNSHSLRQGRRSRSVRRRRSPRTSTSRSGLATGGANMAEFAERLGFGAAAVRPAHGRLAGHQRAGRRSRRSWTTSSWRTPRTARARRS